MNLSGLDRYLTTDPRDRDMAAYERWCEDRYPDDSDDHYDEFIDEMQDAADDAAIERAEARREDPDW